MSVISAAGSTAFTMSNNARQGTVPDASASISTPVLSADRTPAETRTASSSTTRATSTPWMAMGWHSGTRSGVRFAAMIPAIRATESASPLGSAPSRSSRTTSALTTTRPRAVAVRTATSLPDTSTMRASPRSFKCVKSVTPGLDSTLSPFEQHGRDDRACFQLRLRFRHNHERVGAGQRGDQVRTAAADRTDDVLTLLDRDPRAGIRALARRRRPRLGEPRTHRRPVQRLDAEHPSQRRPHEHFERHVGTHRVARQPEERRLVRTDDTEALRHPGLHGHLLELHLADATERLLDDVVGTDADAATGDDEVRADQLVFQRVDQHPGVIRHDADAERDGSGLARRRRQQCAVGVRDLACGQRLARVYQLTAGGQDDDPRARSHRDPFAADGGEQA